MFGPPNLVSIIRKKSSWRTCPNRSNMWAMIKTSCFLCRKYQFQACQQCFIIAEVQFYIYNLDVPVINYSQFRVYSLKKGMKLHLHAGASRTDYHNQMIMERQLATALAGVGDIFHRYWDVIFQTMYIWNVPDDLCLYARYILLAWYGNDFCTLSKFATETVKWTSKEVCTI